MELKSFIYKNILPFVSKPGRYIGNEVNIIRKDLNRVRLRVALVFPDLYEVGMSYNGFSILYHILNRMEGVYAERVFAPWPDMETKMRHENVPLFSLETFSPLTDFDAVGFTLPYEMHYPGILNLLDLSKINVFSRERSGLPLILGGGTSVFNPEPVADFFDAIVIGDGEEAVPEIATLLLTAKQERQTRTTILQQLGTLGGVYVPSFYQSAYNEEGRFIGLENGASKIRIRARIVSELKRENYPDKLLVPTIQTAHDHVALEIARGCSRGCRFCNAGMIYRPVRERSVDDLISQALANLDSTGFEEIALVSLSTSDYGRLNELLTRLSHSVADRRVNIAFPSLRPASFTPDVAQFAKGVRKSGLTFAPEAGTDRLRRIINKETNAEELLRALALAFKEGWNTVKLYFMIGQPDEREDDLLGIAELVLRCARLARQHGGRQINVSISPFVPKACTPFQWVRQDTVAEIDEKIRFLKQHIRGKNVKLTWRDGTLSRIEGVLARGDRRMSRVIYRAWQLGAKLDGWSEWFDPNRWEQAMVDANLTFEQFTNGYPLSSPLPWDHIDKGITKKFLQDEYRRALGEHMSSDCRESLCHRCGLMGQKVCRDLGEKACDNMSRQQTVNSNQGDLQKVRVTDVAKNETVEFYRVKYTREHDTRFLSHLDIIRMFERALRRAKIYFAYSKGFNPRPKISYGPPLTTGFTSEAEYFDLEVEAKSELTLKNLNDHLPQGFKVVQIKALAAKPRSLASLLGFIDYMVSFPDSDLSRNGKIPYQQLLQSPSLPVERVVKIDKKRFLDIRPFIKDIQSLPDGFILHTKIINGQTVRVEEVLRLLFPEQDTLIQSVLVHRLAVWLQDGERLYSPMDE